MFDKRYWIWLSLAFDVADAVSDKLLFDFGGDPEAIYRASYLALKRSIPNEHNVLRKLIEKDLHTADRILDFCEVNNIGILTQDSRRYPPSLLSIRGRPIVLYYKGSLPDFSDRLAIAVVGTRRVSDYGSNAAYSISYDLAKNGAIVVSGMALGTDGAAHHGALDALGTTVAVLGSGIDVVYPRSNAELYDELTLNGTVITEFPPQSRPEGWHFPQRNRIISGLSSGILVVEAAEKSGSLITADHAKKQGRMIYAVPGKVGELASLGTNNLIRDGAKVVTCADDILKDFSALYQCHADKSSGAKHPHRKPGAELRVSEPVVSVTLAQQKKPPNRSSGYMSAEVDPKLEAAGQAKRKREEIKPSPELEYPPKTPNKHGFGMVGFWNNNESESATGNGALRGTTALTSDDRSASASGSASPRDFPGLSENERRIIDFIVSHEKANADELTLLDIPAHVISSRLTLLEIKGLIECTDDGYYHLI